MNPGYLSLILLSITLIMLVSGWREICIRSISNKVILLFFIGWLCLSWATLHIRHVQISFTYLLVAFVSSFIVLTRRGVAHKLHLLSIGLLLGSSHFLLLEILLLNPMMIISKPEIDTAICLSLLVVVLQRNELEQIACLSIGLLLGDFYYSYVHKSEVPVYLGAPDFQDKWWLSILLARTVTLIMQSAYLGCKGAVKMWLERKRGWKK